MSNELLGLAATCPVHLTYLKNKSDADWVQNGFVQPNKCYGMHSSNHCFSLHFKENQKLNAALTLCTGNFLCLDRCLILLFMCPPKKGHLQG
uniref:Uncharacterized protein n=1 Tax=Rhizophora mucronata TaxID=61149 RepID=A0A2P2QQJ3_RHIMU